MNREPEITMEFPVTMKGTGVNADSAWQEANELYGLSADTWWTLKVVEFKCPCGSNCVAVQSERQTDLQSDYARTYVCVADGRRWTLDSMGDVDEQTRWVVLQNIAGDWENCWSEEDPGATEMVTIPTTFASLYDATTDLANYLRDCKVEYENGNLRDVPGEEDFKVMTLRKYLNLDELESKPDGWHFGSKIYDADGYRCVNQYVTDYGDEDVKIEWTLHSVGWQAYWEGSDEEFYTGSDGDLPTREDFVEAYNILHQGGAA